MHTLAPYLSRTITMSTTRPNKETLLGKDVKDVPMSCQRVMDSVDPGKMIWIGPDEAASLTDEEQKQYELAHQVLQHLAVQAPLTHKSGHPGGPLSAFTPSYWVYKMRDPSVDQPLRMSPGHLSILAYGLIYLFGRDKGDARLSSPQNIIDTFL